MNWKNISKEKILFLLIDFQTQFFSLFNPSLVKASRTNILLFIRIFKELGIPMIGTEHNREGLGGTDTTILNEWAGSPFIDKVTFGCCGNDVFNKQLQEISRPVIVVAGLETQICVLQTVIELLEREYEVLVVSDAVLSTTKLKWRNGLELMKDADAYIVNTDTLLFYLIKRADTKEFKYLVKLLKNM